MSGNTPKTFRGSQESHEAFDAIVAEVRRRLGIDVTAAQAMTWLAKDMGLIGDAHGAVHGANHSDVQGDEHVRITSQSTVQSTDSGTPVPRTHAVDSLENSSSRKHSSLIPSQAAAPGLRSEGTNPRALGTNPRALGTNPRALGTNPRAVGANPRAADNRGVVVALPEDELTPHQLRTAQRVLHRWGKTLSAKYGAVEPCDHIPPALARAVQRWPSSRQWDAAIDRLDDMSKAAIARYSMTTLEHACRAPRSQPGGLPKLFEDYRAAQKDPPPLHEVLSGKQLDNWRKPPESVTAPTADDAERWCRLLAENDPVWWVEVTAEMRRKAGKVRENGADPDAVLIGQQHWSLGANGDGPAWRGLLDPIIRAAIQQTQQREEDEG